MECLGTIRHLKINLKKNIGPVVIVVEGADYEFDLLNAIFRKVLKYRLVTKSRNQSDFKEYNEYVMNGNENSKFIVINTKNSNIGSIEDDEKYRNEVYKMAYEKYNIDLKNCPLYFIWDRDQASNKKDVVKDLLEKLQNPYENLNYESGLLLLSYPCVEAYTISCFEKNKEYMFGNIKEYVNKKKKYKLTDLDRYKIQRATIEMINNIYKLGIEDFEIDNIGKINQKIFEKEEDKYKIKKEYFLLSMISYILLDLGIITFRSDN